MGRKPSFDDRQVYAALGRILAESGQATLADIREATGLSTGSLYHRFGSREGLMAEAWLATVSAFQQRFVAALSREDDSAGVEAALETPRFCRREPDLSLVLVCCRPSEFLTGEVQAELRACVANVNKEASSAIARFAKRIDRPLLACRLALVALPLGAVRLFLPKQRVPVEVDDYIRKAVAAMLLSD
jgi:AcrR family transcriptional regulator